MDPLVKQAIRDEELVVIEFFFECAQIQHSAGRYYLWENPRGSELLRIAQSKESANNTNATDNVLCMCSHELRDPVTRRHREPESEGLLFEDLKPPPATLFGGESWFGGGLVA